MVTTLPTLSLPGFRVEEMIGSGACSRVYRARNLATDRDVALKEFLARPGAGPNALREASTLLSLNHPHVIRCEDFLYAQGRYHYLVLEYANGGNLRQEIEERTEGFAEADVLTIAKHTALGLRELHEHGFIHGDLKPENILRFESAGETIYKLSDFGISWHCSQEYRGGVTNGSPAYMAPEVFYDQPHYSSDLYALGVILYELLSGTRPFSGLPIDVFQAQQQGTLDLGLIPTEFWREVLHKLLHHDPRQRGHTAQDLLPLLDPHYVSASALPDLPIELMCQSYESARAHRTQTFRLPAGRNDTLLGYQTGQGEHLLICQGESTDRFSLTQNYYCPHWLPRRFCAMNPTGASRGRLLLANERELFWLNTSTDLVTPLLRHSRPILAIAVDEVEGQLYFYDGRQLQAVSHDGHTLWSAAADHYVGRPQLWPVPGGGVALYYHGLCPVLVQHRPDGTEAWLRRTEGWVAACSSDPTTGSLLWWQLSADSHQGDHLYQMTAAGSAEQTLHLQGALQVWPIRGGFLVRHEDRTLTTVTGAGAIIPCGELDPQTLTVHTVWSNSSLLELGQTNHECWLQRTYLSNSV